MNNYNNIENYPNILNGFYSGVFNRTNEYPKPISTVSYLILIYRPINVFLRQPSAFISHETFNNGIISFHVYLLLIYNYLDVE